MEAGTLIEGRYEIVRELGAGAMGKVFLATHRGTGRKVALKVILRDDLGDRPDVVARFQREAKAAASIATRHIAQILDTSIDPATQRPYLVMELLVGEDCRDLIRRVRVLAPRVALKIAAQACLGLAKAHDVGVIHRDIKPANLFLDRTDEADVAVKLCDFGIAKLRFEQDEGDEEHALTRTGSLIGSPLYMSPEQARAKKTVDGRSDLWSLGVVLYELLTGQTPFHGVGSLADLLITVCSVPAAPLREFAPWVDAEIEAAVHRALEIDASKRYASASEMHAALMALLPGGSSLERGELVAISDEARGSAGRPEPEGPTPVDELAPTRAVHPSPREAAEDAVAASRDGLANTKPEEVTRAPRRAALGIAVGALTAVAAGTLVWRLAPGASHAPDTSHAPSADARPDAVPAGALTRVTITGDSFSGYSTLRSSAFADALKKDGIELAFRVEVSPRERAKRLEDGTAQLNATSLDQYVLQSAGGKIVALVDTTCGADALVLDHREFPDVQDMAGLQPLAAARRAKGNKLGLAFVPESASEYLSILLDARFASFDLGDFDLRPTPDPADAFEKLVTEGNGTVAAVLWEPFVTRARKQGFRVILSSADVDAAVADVLVASNAFLSSQPRTVATVVAHYYRQVDTLLAQPHKLYAQVAADAALDEEEAHAVADGIRFFSAVTAKSWMTGGELVRQLEGTAAVLSLAGKLERPLKDAASLIHADAAEAAAKNTETLIAAVKKDNPTLAARLAGNVEERARPAIDAKALASVEVLGRLGELRFASGRRELDDPARLTLEAAAKHADDFNPGSTVIRIAGAGASASILADLARDLLQEEKVQQPIAVVIDPAAPLAPAVLRIELVRAPKASAALPPP